MSYSKSPALVQHTDALAPYLPSLDTIDHLLRYLGTWSGSDKFFMIIQYTIKLIVPILNARARLQHRAGLRPVPSSAVSHSLTKFAGIIGDSRMLWRIWGLLPIVRWLISIERNPPVTRSLLNIERLQGLSMLVYYPFEHLYYLTSHSLIPTSFKLSSSENSSTEVKLDPGKLALWSTRFWAVYVFLQLLHLRQDRKQLQQRQRLLRKSKTALTVAEQEEIDDRWDSYRNEMIVNLGYAPLTLHWSLPNGLFKNDIWIAAFGLLAGLASFRAGWKATALRASQKGPITDSVDTPTIEEKDVS